jgi:nitrous oxide reductase accessory protein NosL
MILLGSGLFHKAKLFYLKSTDDSNIFCSTIDLYEAWNKPEKAKELQRKLTKIEDFEE